MAGLAWTSHLTSKEEKDEFLLKIKSSKRVLERLEYLIKETYTASENEMRKRENFAMAAWSEKQAYELGIQKGLQTVLKLIKA